MKYILVDAMNLFFRAKHSTHRASDTWTKVGFCLHIMFSSVNKVVRKLDGDHVVFLLDGRSWRKDYYEPYKRNRKELRDKLSDREQEEEQMFFEIFANFHKYLHERTNCTVHVSIYENLQKSQKTFVLLLAHAQIVYLEVFFCSSCTVRKSPFSNYVHLT